MLSESKTWIEDIDRIVEELPELYALENKSIIITGATGLVCSAVVDLLMRFVEKEKIKILVSVTGRDINKLNKRFKNYIDNPFFNMVIFDACDTNCLLSGNYDYIIHGASNAYPDIIMKEPVETMLSNILGLKKLLDYANENETKRVLYISSSEVYGQKDGGDPYEENQYGYIDLLNARNSYSVSKRAAETLCVSYSEEYGVDSVIVRPGHIYGPTASSQDKRVSSAWAYAAARGEKIVMKSSGSQLRSYCYCLDCASAIVKVLIKGEKCCAYNISNPNSIISIKQMAELLSKCAGVELITEEPTSEEKKGFNPMDNSSLNSKCLLSLGWKGFFSAEKGFDHTVTILKEIMNQMGER